MQLAFCIRKRARFASLTLALTICLIELSYVARSRTDEAQSSYGDPELNIDRPYEFYSSVQSVTSG